MNTTGLEWFGPPERNTLHPLCVVLPVLTRDCSRVVLAGEQRVCVRESLSQLVILPCVLSLLYDQGEHVH